MAEVVKGPQQLPTCEPQTAVELASTDSRFEAEINAKSIRKQPRETLGPEKEFHVLTVRAAVGSRLSVVEYQLHKHT